jgi:hypothetical protein
MTWAGCPCHVARASRLAGTWEPLSSAAGLGLQHGGSPLGKRFPPSRTFDSGYRVFVGPTRHVGRPGTAFLLLLVPYDQHLFHLVAHSDRVHYRHVLSTAEDRVDPVEMRLRRVTNEELAATGIFATMGHGE